MLAKNKWGSAQERQSRKGMRQVFWAVLLCCLFFSASLAVRSEAATVKFSAKVKRTKLMVGEQSQIVFSNTKRITYRFKSSNKKVAAVGKSTGLITAKKKGKAVITITGTWTKGSKTQQWTKKVQLQVNRVYLSKTELNILRTKTARVKVKGNKFDRKVRWYSRTPEICSVNEEGMVYAIREGEGSIFAEVGGALVLDCKVTVKVNDLPERSIVLLVNRTHTYGAVDLAHEMQTDTKTNDPVELTVSHTELGHLNGNVYNADHYGTNIVTANSGPNRKTYRITQKVWSGHRGYSDMYPENTIDAFEGAGRSGAAFIETDIRRTADGELVCMHDDELGNMTNASNDMFVSDCTLEQIRALEINNGNNLAALVHKQVPTLEEFLRICKKYDMIALIELKDLGTKKQRPAAAQKVLQAINATGMQNQCIVISFSATRLIAFREQAGPSIPVAALNSTVWGTLQNKNVENAYSYYDKTSFGPVESQDYSLIVGRKNLPTTTAFHNRV